MKIFFTLVSLFFSIPAAGADESWFTPTHRPAEPQNLYWRPLVSLVLPGFDQYLQGHITSGLVYSSIWLGSSAAYANRAERLREAQDEMQWDRWTDQQKNDYINHEELPRQATLSLQYVTSVGAMSAWHSFRSVVETQKLMGRFEFLEEEETPMDLLTAPFQFEYLQRKTTWIPLLIAAGIGALSPNVLSEEYERDPYSSSDAAYASAISYNAGVAEEALFRGYMQPLFYEASRSPQLANGLQAVIFALAHRATVDRPFAQAGMGFYLGWLHQKRDWTLGESIFIHAWWDVIALSSHYVYRLKDAERGPPPVIWLPAFSILF